MPPTSASCHRRPGSARRLAGALAAALGLAGGAMSAAAVASPAESVLIVVNDRFPGSSDLGRYYALARAIAPDRVLRIHAATGETIPGDEFDDRVLAPIRARIEGMPEPPRHLVLIRGVPVAVRTRPGTTAGPLQRTDASVDGELALALAGGIGVPGPAANPAFGSGGAWARGILRVARLDGPDDASVRALIDGALAAERSGLWGRAYIDMGGPYPAGDDWLGRAADMLEAAGFPVVRDRAAGLFQQFERFDRPVIYLGWHRANLEGVFLREGFRFPPGAVAFHIHSFSAAPVRDARKAWVGPLVSRGAAVTLGNVNEPYLQFTHRPDILVERLLEGDCVGDAAARALAALGWQAVLIGDPLYRPFPGGRAALLERARASDDPYAAVMAARILARAPDPSGARAVLAGAWERSRHPVLAVAALELTGEAVPADVARMVAASAWGEVGGEPGILDEAIRLARRRGLDAAADQLAAMRRPQRQ